MASNTICTKREKIFTMVACTSKVHLHNADPFMRFNCRWATRVSARLGQMWIKFIAMMTCLFNSGSLPAWHVLLTVKRFFLRNYAKTTNSRRKQKQNRFRGIEARKTIFWLYFATNSNENNENQFSVEFRWKRNEAYRNETKP